MLGQLFLLACLAAMLSIAAILFILFGPVPVKRRVVIVPRLSVPVAATAMPSLVSRLAPAREQQFTPAPHHVARADSDFLSEPGPAAVPAMPARKPKGAKVQPLPRKRAAKGTDSPFAPVVRHRNFREEEVATNPVRRVSFESGEMTTVD